LAPAPFCTSNSIPMALFEDPSVGQIGSADENVVERPKVLLPQLIPPVKGVLGIAAFLTAGRHLPPFCRRTCNSCSPRSVTFHTTALTFCTPVGLLTFNTLTP
jgi:hypothetical protein